MGMHRIPYKRKGEVFEVFAVFMSMDERTGLGRVEGGPGIVDELTRAEQERLLLLARAVCEVYGDMMCRKTGMTKRHSGKVIMGARGE
jgi:hypothetical protein